MMKKTLLCLVFVALLNACSSDDGNNKKFDGSSEEIRNFVTPELIEKMTDMGMMLHSGSTPPEITGNYFVQPVLEASTLSVDVIGRFFSTMNLHFENQQANSLTIDFSYVSMSQEGQSTKSFIAGSGNKFSVYLKSISVDNDLEAESIMVVSGEISDEGIIDYQMAAFMLNNNGHDTVFMGNGDGRIFNDSDGLGVRMNAAGRPAVSKTEKNEGLLTFLQQ